jgi:hypothetical protein
LASGDRGGEMRNLRMIAVFLGLVLTTASCPLIGPRATIKEEKRVIKTYPFGDPDPVPILARNRNAAIYLISGLTGFPALAGIRSGRSSAWRMITYGSSSSRRREEKSGVPSRSQREGTSFTLTR